MPRTTDPESLIDALFSALPLPSPDEDPAVVEAAERMLRADLDRTERGLVCAVMRDRLEWLEVQP